MARSLPPVLYSIVMYILFKKRITKDQSPYLKLKIKQLKIMIHCYMLYYEEECIARKDIYRGKSGDHPPKFSTTDSYSMSFDAFFQTCNTAYHWGSK
jgi:hypothetical protein